MEGSYTAKYNDYNNATNKDLASKSSLSGKQNAKKFSEDELFLLNLIAELIVEIIIKETADECDRLCEDQ